MEIVSLVLIIFVADVIMVVVLQGQAAARPDTDREAGTRQFLL